MKHFTKLIMPLIVLFGVACEKLGSEIEPYANEPQFKDESCGYAIQDADENSVTFQFWIAVDNLIEDIISVEFSSTSKSKDMHLVYDAAYNDYVGSITFDREDFESIDSYNYIAKTPSFTLTLFNDDGNYVDRVSYSGFTYSRKPSIAIYDLQNKGTTAYGQDGYDYKTPYSFTCKISGAFFLREKYWYYIGNWSNPGKGASESVYDGSWTSNRSVLFNANFSGNAYMQLRAVTHRGYEICSDKSIHLGKYNTITEVCEISLVDSSGVKESSYTTRSANVMAIEAVDDMKVCSDSSSGDRQVENGKLLLP